MRNSQSPSFYSIYGNALPYYLDRADLCGIDQAGQNFATKWMDGLMKGELQTQVNTNPAIAYKLRHLFFESKNLERVKGAKTLGFGYPLFIETYDSDLIIAPVFIWYLNMEASQNKVDSWNFRFGKENTIQPNYRLLRHLDYNYQLDLVEKFESKAFLKQLNRGNISELLLELVDRLNFDNNLGNGEILPSPGLEEIGGLAERGTIFSSGVIGLFPPQRVLKPISVGEKPEEAFSPTTLERNPDCHDYFYLPADPYQATALENAFNQKISVVEGDPSSGKTQTLVNLLINALSNKQKCLVVSERIPALIKVQENLSKVGINQFNFLLKDALHDKTSLLELLKVAATGLGRGWEHNEDDFKLKKTKFSRDKSKLDANYRAIRKNIFGQNNWIETTGLFLASNRREGKELLGSQLNAHEYDFNYEEFELFRDAILSSEPLYRKVNTLKHPLSVLHQDIFKSKASDEGLRFVRTQLKKFQQKTERVHHRYISKTDAYSARLRTHYERHFEQLAKQLLPLKEKIADYSEQFGNDFIYAGPSSLNPFNWFSKKKNLIQKGKDEVSQQYQTLLKIFHRQQYFDFQEIPCKNGRIINKTIENLDQFETSLNQWRGKINGIAQDEILRLNSKTVHPNLDYKEQISELEYALDVLIEEVNESKLLKEPLNNKTLTIPQRQKYLENIIEQLETIQLNLRDFGEVYLWQSNWLGLNDFSQKIIKAIVKVKPSNWMAAFESWYFHNVLTKNFSTDLPNDNSLLDHFANSYFLLKPLILNQIAAHWQDIQFAELKNLKKKNKKVYQQIFDKNNHQKTTGLPLNLVLEEGFDAVSAMLPILFVTPHIAENVIPQLENYFDYIIFDEANRLSVENATRISALGKRQVLFGSNDTHGNETSLLQYVKENGVPTSILKKRYTNLPASKPEPFNANGKLSTEFYFGTEIEIENVEGRFDEKEGINDVEAQNIIRLLNNIKRTPQRLFPSVGIVTFTVEQRDLISSYLLKLKQQNATGSDKIRQLERNGMGIFHVDELFGQHFDILIISFTLGTVNFKGALSKKYMFFNTPEGISHIRLLLHKSPKTSYIIHSIPSEYQEKFLSKPADVGTYLLAKFLQFATAVQENDTEKIKALSADLFPNISGEKSHDLFTNEVAKASHAYIESDRIHTRIKHEKVQVPLSIKPVFEHEPPMVIHPDGFFAETDSTSYLWEYQQREKISSSGIKYHPIWTTNWWKNPKQEARLLASQIIKHDSLYQPKIVSTEISKKDKDKEEKAEVNETNSDANE